MTEPNTPPKNTDSAEWIEKLVGGDDDAAREFWADFGKGLETVADKNLSPKMKRRVAPEDVVQSACRTFFRRAREGQFELADRDGLWGLLAARPVSLPQETRCQSGAVPRGGVERQSLGTAVCL